MLATLDQVKAQLGITSVAQDAALSLWNAGADAAVKGYTHRDLEQTTYPGCAVGGDGDSGYYDGNGSLFLILRQWPVTSVTSVYVDATGRYGENPDGAFASDTLLTYGTDYDLRLDGCLPGTTTKCSNSGILRRIGFPWPSSWVKRYGQILPRQIQGNGNIRVNYVAGYPTIPVDLIIAVAQIVAVMRSSAKQGLLLQSETQGAYSYALAQQVLNSMPALGTTRQLLAKYRRVDL